MTHPVTSRVMVWLADTGDCKTKAWHIGCLICKKQGFKNVFGKFRAEPKLCNILRHANCDQHKAAVEKFEAEDEKVEDGLQQKEVPAMAVNYAHFIFQRTLLSTASSFSNFQSWVKSAQLTGALAHKSLDSCWP